MWPKREMPLRILEMHKDDFVAIKLRITMIHKTSTPCALKLSGNTQTV